MTYPIHDAVAKISADANPKIRYALDLIADKIEPVAATPPPPPSGYTPAPPEPPSAYTVPNGATLCHSTADLRAALSGSAPIVLADGEYDYTSWLTNSRGLAIYAQNLGKAVLRCGLVLGGNAAMTPPLVQGVTFGAHDPAKCFQGAALNIWGAAGAKAFVLDTFWDGAGSAPYGLVCLAPDGLVFQRAKQLSAYTYTVWRLSDNNASSAAAMHAVTDLDGAGALTYNNGRDGVVLWLGHPVGTCTRLRLGKGATASLETVNAFARTTISDYELFGSPVLHYCEHFTTGDTFERYYLHDGRTGINGEWADPAWGSKPGTRNCKWIGGTIATSLAGAYFDKGSDSNAVTNTRFVGQSWAAVGAYQNVGLNDFATGNTYAMQAGAVRVATTHI